MHEDSPTSGKEAPKIKQTATVCALIIANKNYYSNDFPIFIYLKNALHMFRILDK